MANQVSAHFINPSTVATHLGETVGTHYCAALRAAEAYGTHLAGVRESLLLETFEEGGLGNFWRDLLRSEQVHIGSPNVLKSLSTTPSHYFRDFLDTADAVYRRRYKDVPSHQRTSLGKLEHAQCLRFLRDHKSGGQVDHFTVQNKVATWMQLLRIMGRYQE